ncbi:MAG: BREX-1 system adenine-specific DNA-methyltransferase PglX, partial [Draconibacterium sp.]|nr:BREX-1 system adenine-specific DNA-methyltransferase PglX [Draconibacterium sp.]
MSMFQKSVEKKYLNELDSSFVDKKYTDFQNYFGNPERQENIRNAKEEQFQEGFLRALFVNILGYTLNPELNFNLTTELKNISNSKKADGAILRTRGHDPLTDAHAVIELKSTNTTDLDSIETQAFGYKNHHPKCVYVITSNFEKLRFYIQNAVDHIDFDLFNLTREQFSLMWLCLAKDNLLNDLPLKIKDASVLQEENITKKLYADYSKFRTAIYNNLIKNNPDTDKLLLFKKTQKLLDRFLFIFFAEDRLLLPPNSISEIVKQWTTLKDELDEYVPLYARFKKYFGYMNTGFKGKKYDIYAYNGGLFKPDEILDNILIDDEILLEHTVKLSNYDFETDVDVNILGHIFEHSLGEIAAIAATTGHDPLTGTGISASRRKKDGIFYTPKYITKYIVENTVGKLCSEKRNELQIIDEEYAKGRKNRKKEIVKTLDKKLDEYRNWLLTLTILDPACGSGAFLNQALEFLINEHRKIDELRTQLFGGAIIFSDITTDILEKNIFGVDLNEESVEIAKLSLWLRTAQKGRKLNTLSNNIKCGNSLIDDPEFAGDKAFNWQNEFPDIFRKKEKKAWHITTAT